jgi:hypothetical protein
MSVKVPAHTISDAAAAAVVKTYGGSVSHPVQADGAGVLACLIVIERDTERDRLIEDQGVPAGGVLTRERTKAKDFDLAPTVAEKAELDRIAQVEADRLAQAETDRLAREAELAAEAAATA